MTDLPQANESSNPPVVQGAGANAKPKSRWHWRTLVRPLNVRHWSRTRIAFVLAFLIIGITVPGVWWTSCGFEGCPSTVELQAWRPTEGGAVLDLNGQLIGPLVPVKRLNVPLSKIPALVQRSFIAVEDRRFHTHHGVDWRGVARAMLVNMRAFGVREGASTISMQLARNVFLAHRASERSFGRKLLEWRYAGLLERALTKDQILERYLNAIYLGNGVYGVEGASRDLFGKNVAHVTLAEAAMLAGLPKAPSSYSPRRDPARARARRDVVLSILEREKVANRSAVVAAHAYGVKVVTGEWTPNRIVDSWALEVVRSAIDSLRASGAIPAGLTNANLVVRTTFDRKAQRIAERAVARGAAHVDAERGISSGDAAQTQGAIVALDPTTGAIRAIVGGRRVERKGFNRALLARRQPGSAFKPFVYVTALQQGYTTATLVDDEPVSVQAGSDIWTPANFGEEYAGRITLRQALVRSSNAATVRVSRDVGIARVASMAEQLGISSELPDVPALALGSGEVTPMELTTAYAPFGNGGWRVTPHMLVRIDDAFGRMLWRGQPTAIARVIDSTDAFLVTSMMRSVVDDGTARGVRNAGIKGPVAGKTGTTNDGADVWFVGYTPTLVAAVWFGADTPQPLGPSATGGRLAVPAWSEFVRDGWHSPAKDVAWQPPSTLVSRQVDVASGALASDWCGESRREWFKPGSEPREQCSDFDVEGRSSVTWLEDGIRGVISAIPAEPVRQNQRGARASEREINKAIEAVTRQIGQAKFTQNLARKLMNGFRSATREGAEALKEQRAQIEREYAREMQRAHAAQRRAQQQINSQMQRDLERATAAARNQERE
ncbi:MAG: PBP1A family penicillin-binding protein [Phycisphaerae bacterium]|nr:PBP1A family penicillin-binding protein [Gemmatimonadaceae bacterium]